MIFFRQLRQNDTADAPFTDARRRAHPSAANILQSFSEVSPALNGYPLLKPLSVLLRKQRRLSLRAAQQRAVAEAVNRDPASAYADFIQLRRRCLLGMNYRLGALSALSFAYPEFAADERRDSQKYIRRHRR